jgi:hypothetical protein
MKDGRRDSSPERLPVWNTPEILSSDRDCAQDSIISPSGSRCSSSQEISSRERRNFEGIRVKCLVIVEEHPRRERFFSMGRSKPLLSNGCDPSIFAMAQQSPGCMVCLWVSSSESESEPASAPPSSRSPSFPHPASCMVNETRFLNEPISANSSSTSRNRNPSKTSSSMDELWTSKNGMSDSRESRKSMPRSSRWCRFWSFGQANSNGNGSAPVRCRPKTVLGPSGFCESISNHRVESSTDRSDISDRGAPTSSERTPAIVCEVDEDLELEPCSL